MSPSLCSLECRVKAFIVQCPVFHHIQPTQKKRFSYMVDTYAVTKLVSPTFGLVLCLQQKRGKTGPKVHRCVCLCVCRSVMSHSLRPQGLYPARLLCPWDSPGKNTGAGCHSLVQGIFPAQRLNLGLLHYRQILYRLSHQGSPMIKQPKFLMSLCLMT